MLPVQAKNTEKLVTDDEDDNWYRADFEPSFLLKDSALNSLRREIRQEQRERRDLYLPWISAITGLLAVVLGIVTVLFSRTH